MKKKQYKLIAGYKCWHCPKCNSWKWTDAFYKDTRTANGLKSQCKKCHIECGVRTRDRINTRRLRRESMRRRRTIDLDKYRKRGRLVARAGPKNTPAKKAYSKLHTALRNGSIKKPPCCEDCTRRIKLTAHHEDYNKPLDVKWLCYECHGQRHWME